MNRVALAAVVAGALLAGSVFYILTTRERDAVGDNRDRSAAAVAALPPTADPPPSREPREPAPRAPERPPSSRRRLPGAPVAPAAPVAPVTATLRITSDVAGAQVFLNREFVGATPATAGDLQPGEYQLNVAAPGYDNHVATITVSAGERDIVVNFREVRLDASLDVVHKHRFGSCRGRLVATPQGLRYETGDTDDVFSAALLDLRTFEVDYLKKNLRIQPRKGKRYDFTDPDGNADRLFVFHRDVERARERLEKGDVPAGQ